MIHVIMLALVLGHLRRAKRDLLANHVLVLCMQTQEGAQRIQRGSLVRAAVIRSFIIFRSGAATCHLFASDGECCTHARAFEGVGGSSPSAWLLVCER